MTLSIKQKQVLGVTSIVALVALGLSLAHLAVVARVLLEQSRARGELLAQAVFHRAREVVTSRESAYQDLRADQGVQSILESAIYSQNVTYAAIVDPAGSIVAHSDPDRLGETLEAGDDLGALLDRSAPAQLGAVFGPGKTLEWRQPMLMNGDAFGEIRIGISTLLVRREISTALGPAAVGAGLALLVAVLVALVLAQRVLRPIHVIQSGLTRLGRGDLDVTLDLGDEEFKDLGDVFSRLTAQLKAVAPDAARRPEVRELSQRVMALGRLTAGVAHEVKNPLNAMTIHLELLRQKLAAEPDTAGRRAHLDVIAAEIRRLDDVVQGFLKFARPEELALRPVDPGALVADVAGAVEAEAHAARVTVEQACAAGTPAVEADAGLLRQALLNLAKNAVQAMPDGGRLRLGCGRNGDRHVEIRVEDSGVGIPAEHLAKIFDLYFTTRPSGTGIGLSLVYRTVQLHNGDIDVVSVPGKGTTFVIKLPLAG